MILQDNFYSISSLSTDESTILATIELASNHAIFEGHFPNNPVTPGVVEMEIVKEILATGLDKKVKLHKMSSCKFLAILNPLENNLVSLEIKRLEQQDNLIRINAQIFSQEKGFLKMAAEYFIA